MTNIKLAPCAQINVTMAPDVGRSRHMYFKEGIVDRMIVNNKMEGGVTSGGKAQINLCLNNPALSYN